MRTTEVGVYVGVRLTRGGTERSASVSPKLKGLEEWERQRRLNMQALVESGRANEPKPQPKVQLHLWGKQ